VVFDNLTATAAAVIGCVIPSPATATDKVFYRYIAALLENGREVGGVECSA
jgi:hypothetical protein